MKIEKGEISSSQLTFLMIGFMQGAHLLITFTAGITKHDTWLAVLAALTISLPFVLIYVALAQKFPGKNLVQINDIIYGPYLGKLVSTLYICYFLLLASLNLRTVFTFFGTFIMPETPMVVFLIMFIFICAWAVRNGIETIARCSLILIVIAGALILIAFILLLNQMEITNFLPVFEVPPQKFIQGTHIVTALPFTQTVVFLMIIPYMNKIKEAKKSMVMGLILGGIQLLIVVIQDTAVLGITETIMVLPSFESTRLIDIANVLTRLDVLVAVVLLVTLFLRISIFYYAVVLGIAQMFKLRSYVSLVLPIGIIIISVSILIYDSTMVQAAAVASTYLVYSFPFHFILPILSLLIAWIRGIPKKREET